MRKLWYTFLALALIVSVMAVLAVPASAAGASISISSGGKTAVHPGEEVTFTFSVNNSTGTAVATLEGTVALSEGLEYVSHTMSCTNSDFSAGCSFNKNNSMKLACAGGNKAETSWEIMKVTCRVKSAAKLGKQSITIHVTDFAGNSGADFFTGDVSSDITVAHSADQHKWVEDSSTTKAATCTADGVKGYKCSDPNCDGKKTEPGEKALGHDWPDSGNVTFTWGETDGKTKPTATYEVTCTREGCSEKQKLIGTVSEQRQEPGCETDGKVTYTATASVTDGEGAKTYTGTTDVTLPHTGHKWGKVDVVWTPATGKPTAGTATVKCSNPNCEHPTDTATVGAADIQESGQGPTCEEAGYKGYYATFTFTYATEKNGDYVKEEEVVPATGHDWGTADITWAADNSSVTATRTCKNDASHKDTVTATAKEVVDEDPTCTEPGSHHYEATGTYSTSKETFKDETEPAAVPATGHDFGDNEPNVDWPVEFPNVWKDKTGPLPVIDGMTVTLHCDNENKDIKGEVIEINETEIEEVKPTYTDDGSATFTAKVEFPDGKNGTLQLTSAPKTYTLPKLPLPEPSAKVPDGKVGADAEKNLAASAGSIVEDVLKGSTPAGVPDDIVQAIKDAASSNQAGSMLVSTELTITADSTYTGTGVASAYDVTVTMTVTGETGTKSAQISHVAQPIEIKLPKGNAGPIVKVVHIVNGNQESVASKIVGDDVVFTAQDFSTYAIIFSNDLEDAEISGVEPSYTYTGKAIEPAVKVTINGGNETLKEGTDYTVEYSGNDKPGTATVTIKGIGNYTGSVTKTFTILESAATAAPSTTPTATKAPSAPGTGDETPVALFAAVLTACAAVLGVVLFLVRRRQQQK